MIIEDEDDINDLLGKLLWHYYNKCASRAQTVQEAQAVMETYPPNFILLDLELQGKVENGLDLARLLRSTAATKDAYIIAISNHSWQVEVEQAAFDAGCDLCLEKQSLFSNFTFRLDEALEKLAQMRQIEFDKVEATDWGPSEPSLKVNSTEAELHHSREPEGA